MRDAGLNQSLTFPQLPIGKKETPVDLKRLLYKGAAGIRRDKAEQVIQNGLFGDARLERLELLCRLHDHISGKLACGGSPVSARNKIAEITAFFAWADQHDAPLTIGDIQATYVNWSEHLVHRCQVAKTLSLSTVYDCANKLGDILDGVLGRQKPILHLTRITKPKRRRQPQGIKAEKQNLSGTFAFGHLLQDICDGLSLSAVWSLRIEIPLRGGGVVVPWTGGSTPRTTRTLDPYEVRASEERRRVFEADHSLEHRGRKAVVNMRIMAELLMFIGQTGMNLAQAHSLKLRHFSYSSDINGYKVRDYKRRRSGEVLFEIFSEYRAHFERYLEWRKALFPNSEELFPVMRDGSRASCAPRFDLIIGACRQARVPWTPPSTLRGTRVNWILRRSGDQDLTAEVAQHHKRVLLEVYEIPSLQLAIGEVTRFWQSKDPALAGTEALRAAALGQCDGMPVTSPAKPQGAPSPDCTYPSGCLWCEHYRDIDTFDYVWAVACFRHLKILEISKHCFPLGAENLGHPARYAIDKLSEKLTWFKNSSATRRGWVEEALARVEEGNYHDEWLRLIQGMEEHTI